MRYFFVFLSIPLLFSLSGSLAHAHGVGGSLEKVVDGYLVDIGYQPLDPRSGTPTAYDFIILDPDTGRPVDFTSVWVRLTKGSRTIFAGGIGKARLGPTTMVYTYLEGGDDYEMSVRFQNEDGNIVETSFPLTVRGGSAGAGSSGFSLGSILMGAGLGILVGFGSSFALNKKR